MRIRSGDNPQIYLASKNPAFGARQQIDQAISLVIGYVFLRVSIAIAFRLKAELVR
ncbi:hypothetical protein [Nostoc sp. WHI]|uniref:hypothetical protein n=1 Tax=Nostoc sp. WHI TaxID=2650611 RepID=UPI0018C62A7C|nr:hypothetical protein [Nostoc sp. WHI]